MPSPTVDPAVPDRIGPYAIGRRLGGGAQGDVYAAVHDDGSDCAVKVVPARADTDPMELRDEARRLWDAAVPAVVCPTAFGLHDGWMFLAMERDDGVPLDHPGLTLPDDELPEILAFLMGTVTALHDHGVLHLDIKPANILRTHRGRYKLVDFGMARRRGSSDPTGGGTPAYMAPELLHSPPTESADWYGIGATLWTLLHGAPPREPHLGLRPTSPHASPFARRLERLLDPDPRARQDRAPDRPVFVGRERTLELLQTSTAQCIAVIGPAGQGKSTAVERALPTALHGRCYRQDATSVDGFDDLLRLLADESPPDCPDRRCAASMFPELGPGDGSYAESCRLALLRLVRRHADGQRLVVDDLQWMSPEGLRILEDFLNHTRLHLVVVSRPANRIDAWLDRLATRTRIQRIPLPPLSATAMQQLADAWGCPGNRLVGANGNPFLAQWSRAGHPMEQGVERGFDDLSMGHRRLVGLLATARQPVQVRHLRGGTHVAAEALVRSRWIVDADGALELSHALLAEPVENAMTATERRRAHGELLASYRAIRPDRAYRHALALGATDVEDLALRAADAADAQRAHAAASTWYERALSHAARPTTRRAAGRAALSAGRVRAALDHLARLPSVDDDELVLWSAEAQMALGDRAGAMSTLDPLLARHGIGGPGIVRSTLWIGWGLMRLALGRRDPPPRGVPGGGASAAWTVARGLAFTHPLDSLYYAFRAHHQARQEGDLTTLARVQAFIGGGVFLQIPVLQSLSDRLLHGASTMARHEPTRLAHASVDLWRGVERIGTGDWTAARKALAASLEGFETLERVHWEHVTASQFMMWLDWWQGHFGRLGAAADTQLVQAIEREDRLGQAIFRQYQSYADIAAGRTDQAHATSDWLCGPWSADGFTTQTFYGAHIGSLARLYDDDDEGAVELWQTIQADFRRAGGHHVPVSRIDHRLHTARLAIRAGATGELRSLCRSSMREERRDSPGFTAWMQCALGEAAEAEAGRRLSAAGCLAAADAVRHQAGDPAATRSLQDRGVTDPDRWSAAMWPLRPRPK